MRTALFLALPFLARAQSWVPQSSGATASLRGVSAVTKKVVWASGTRGTYLRTIDGGATWQAAAVPGAEQFDFRDVHAFSGEVAYLMSIGTGKSSRIYKTVDGGANWTLQFTNPDPQGFFDALAYPGAAMLRLRTKAEDATHNIAITSDGGRTWTAPAGAPAGFRSAVAWLPERKAWIAAGPSGSDISTDGGQTWKRFDTGNYNAISFVSAEVGWAVGPRGAIARFENR